jgi:hypothetical protein
MRNVMLLCVCVSICPSSLSSPEEGTSSLVSFYLSSANFYILGYDPFEEVGLEKRMKLLMIIVLYLRVYAHFSLPSWWFW